MPYEEPFTGAAAVFDALAVVVGHERVRRLLRAMTEECDEDAHLVLGEMALLTGYDRLLEIVEGPPGKGCQHWN